MRLPFIGASTQSRYIMQKLVAHRTFISFILVLVTLIYCVLTIQQIFNTPSDTAYKDDQLLKNTKTSFDKKTVEQVRQLRTTKDAPATLPSGRINPFIE